MGHPTVFPQNLPKKSPTSKRCINIALLTFLCINVGAILVELRRCTPTTPSKKTTCFRVVFKQFCNTPKVLLKQFRAHFLGGANDAVGGDATLGIMSPYVIFGSVWHFSNPLNQQNIGMF